MRLPLPLEGKLAAVTAYHAIKEMGLSCPETFALIGFDNIPETKFLGLSTVEQPFYDIGYHAASLCVEQKLTPFSGKKHIALPPRVIPRASSAPRELARLPGGALLRHSYKYWSIFFEQAMASAPGPIWHATLSDSGSQ